MAIPDKTQGQAQLSDTARLETFSDGVMAIAITLLVLDLHVPHVHSEHALRHAIASEWPSFAGFFVSFLTIGIMWVNHHHLFKLIRVTTHGFLMINVLFLMAISFIPFPTALVADYLRQPGGRSTAAVVYGVTMVIIAIMFNLVWRTACAKNLLVDGIDPESIERMKKSYLSGPITYAIATLIALVNPFASLALYAALAIYWLLPGSGVRATGIADNG